MRQAIAALGLFTLGVNHEMMNVHDSDLRLIGEKVTVSYVADPILGYGQFRLENKGASVTGAVTEAWLELGGERLSLSDITLYDRPLGKMVDPRNFEVGAGETVTFFLGFPQRVYEPRFGESTSVGLRLSVNGTELQALSPIEFVRRIPRDA